MKEPPELNPSSELEALAGEFQAYAYIVSHDLGAPLRTIVEFSKLLKSEHAAALDEEGRLYLSMIVDGGARMQKMLGGLLAYSRLNTISQPVSTVNCTALLECCLGIARESGTLGKAVVKRGSLPAIAAGEDQLKHLFSILLDNALKFQPPGQIAQIEIFAEKITDAWVFTFKDNGIGIDPAFHKDIFLPFRRLHADSEYPGIGMGLALARKIVEKHHGKILVESATDQGASFMFSLPVQAHDSLLIARK